MGKVHYRQIYYEVQPFLDDCGIKGFKDRYDDVKIASSIRKFIFEHAQIFRQFMYNI